MLSSSNMDFTAEKNFNVFASLLLQGIGVGLILIPGHLGITGSFFHSIILAVFGLLCFIIALSLQVHTIWPLPKLRQFIIRITSVLLLIIGGLIFINKGLLVGAFALFITSGTQAILLLPLRDRHRKFDFTSLTIAFITFSIGFIFFIWSFNPVVGFQLRFISLLTAGLLITAFIGGVLVFLPPFRFKEWIAFLPIFPWLGIIFLYSLPNNRDGLVISIIIISTLLFLKYIPWNRLAVPDGDILSRRVIMISFFAEIAHLIFLGALLFTIDLGLREEYGSVLTAREATLVFFLLFSVMIYYVVTTVVMTINGLLQELNRGVDTEDTDTGEETNRFSKRMERYLRPFIMTPEGIRGRVQTDQINILTRQYATEKNRNAQLTLMLELSQQLDNHLDQPVSAQLAANTLEQSLNCALVGIFLHRPENKDFILLASAGRQKSGIPSGYTQDSSKGMIGRALRQRKTQIANDVRFDPDYLPYKEEETYLSAAVIPLIFNGHVHGVISLSQEKANAFGGIEIGLAETVAAELTRAWERSGYQQRLMGLIQTGSQLASSMDPEMTAQEVTSSTRDILNARFTYVYIKLGQDRDFIQQAHSGNAPLLLASFKDKEVSKDLIDMAFHTTLPFRIRDVRKYEKTAQLKIDNPNLRSLLAIPIRWHNVSIGAIFAFGKQNEVFFTENDQSLAELISIQASGAFETAWLQQELSSTLRITSLLYRLSNQIIQADNIEDSAYDIAQTAHGLGDNLRTGIVLINPEGEVIAECLVDNKGKKIGTEQPMSLIHDAIHSGHILYFSQGESIMRTCLAIQTPLRAYGAIWMDNIEDADKPASDPNEVQSLVTQAAIALERSLLLAESRRQAKEIKAAYDTLEATYDQTLVALTTALDARDRETEGHSIRVTELSVKLGETLGYSADQLKILERGALLHDIGKIGISDTILHKPGKLTEDEWKIMRRHPDIGAKIVEGIPFLEDTIPLILHHQERWDGTGYPGALKGEEIPELARLFSVIDAFDALTSNRPYRQKITKEEALEYLKEQANILFDPKMVDALEVLLTREPNLLEPTIE